VHVVDEAVVLVEPRLGAELDDLGERAAHADAAVAVLAEDHRLAVFEVEHVVGPHVAGGEGVEGVVVEDVAVLEDLDEGDALVAGRRLHHRAEVLDVDVDGAGDEGGLRGDG
jgi:hypothetical protein